MMPEPITAATRNAVPINSAAVRRAIENFIATDAFDFSFDREIIEAGERQGEEEVDSRPDSRTRREMPYRFVQACQCGSGIRHSPVCGDRLAGPDGTNLAGSVVAYGENEIELRRPGLGEFVPSLAAADPCRGNFAAFQRRNAGGMNRARSVASRAVSRKIWAPLLIQDRLRHDRACGISRAQKQNVVAPLHSRSSLLFSCSSSDRSTLHLSARAKVSPPGQTRS